MVWLYKWESDNPRRWSSDFTFTSYEAAKVSALCHALNAHTSKKRSVRELPTSRRIRQQLWRSLRRKGWRVRRQKQPNPADT